MKNIRKKRIIYLLKLTAALFIFLPAESQSIISQAHTPEESIYLSGQWQKDENGWRFYNQWNSSYPAGQWAEYSGNSYYFMDNGYMVTGWHYLNGRWYFFNPYEGKQEGAMVIGWVHDPIRDAWFYTNSYGVMVTGWRLIDGDWYYFEENPDLVPGQMAVSRMIDDAYVDSSGRMNELK